jgi:hypothetical protein
MTQAIHRSRRSLGAKLVQAFDCARHLFVAEMIIEIANHAVLHRAVMV